VFTASAVTTNLPSEPQLNLNCLVLGDEISAGRVFPVRIAKSETVGGLKKAIKKEKKHALDGIDADLVDLWKVSD
jgi:Crinkler effector protein N-terminal domain